MYMLGNVWKCARGKVPECLKVVKQVRASCAMDGNTTGNIYSDYTDRMDTIRPPKTGGLFHWQKGQRHYDRTYIVSGITI